MREPDHIRSVIQYYLNQLRAHHYPDAALTLRHIIEDALHRPYIDALTHDAIIDVPTQDTIQSAVHRCLNHEPLAYVLGHVGFNGHDYIIEPGVLIPRPETEELVAHAITMIQPLINQGTPPIILECGVGSGVIAIELALAFPEVRIIGWDICHRAIAITQKNMTRHNVRSIELVHGNFLHHAPIHTDPCILVANPPYVSETDHASLDAHVQMEPINALVAHENGLGMIHSLIQWAIDQRVALICETGHNQHAHISQRFSHVPLEFKHDLSGRERFVIHPL